MNRVTELLGTKYPIIGGAMQKVSRSQLVIALCEAGALGVIEGGLSPEELEQEIKAVKKATDKPFGVNLFLRNPRLNEQIDVIIKEEVPIVTTGGGSARDVVSILKEAGIKVFPVIASVKHAVSMDKLGVDGLIAEGMEAGGHIGQVTTMSLIPQIKKVTDLPIIAAGGIASGKGLLAALSLGAAGVQIGTVLLTASEAPIHDNYKKAVIEANDTATVVTGSTHRLAVRRLSNPWAEKYLEMEEENQAAEEFEKHIEGADERAINEGDTENGSFMAGQIAGLIDEVRPVKKIIEVMIEEARVALDNVNKVSFLK